MPEETHKFLEESRVGVLAVEMPDGSPHGATVHFAYQKDPLTFVFLTDRSYRKMEPMLEGKTTRAAFVVGTDESNRRTLQLDGTACLTESETLMGVYFAKFPEKREKYEAPDDVFIAFTPTWWRYTDFDSPEGKKSFSSQ